MQIAGLQKFTLVDYPGLIAATVFTRGCSFRCGFCHNPELVNPEEFVPLFTDEEILQFFQKRAGQLAGVCITGGEPTLCVDLLDFIKKLKDLGYKVKLDSNGWDPDSLEKIIRSQTVNYIAMDIKASPEKYSLATGSNIDIDKIKKSINLIMNSDLDYEFRTTFVKPIHELADIDSLGQLISGAERYFIQNFTPSKHVDSTCKYDSFAPAELKEIKKIIQKYVKEVEIRG